MTVDRSLSEEEIDEIVIAQAHDDEFWEEPIQLSDAFQLILLHRTNYPLPNNSTKQRGSSLRNLRNL